MLTETRYFVHYVHRGCLRLKKDLDDATSYSWQRPWELCLHNSLWCRLLSHRIAEAIHRIIFVQILRLFKREHNHRPLFVCRHIGVWEVTCSCYTVGVEAVTWLLSSVRSYRLLSSVFSPSDCGKLVYIITDLTKQAKLYLDWILAGYRAGGRARLYPNQCVYYYYCYYLPIIIVFPGQGNHPDAMNIVIVSFILLDAYH